MTIDPVTAAAKALDDMAFRCVGAMQALRDCSAINGLAGTPALAAIVEYTDKFDAALRAYRAARKEAA